MLYQLIAKNKKGNPSKQKKFQIFNLSKNWDMILNQKDSNAILCQKKLGNVNISLGSLNRCYTFGFINFN